MSNAKQRPVITLTTDFGTADHYVGTMKCVIAGICPEAHIIDITHELAPADLHGAAYTVSQPALFSPPGTIHVVVVDPGVGTSRRGIALQHNHQVFVAPDNGILSLIAPAHTKMPVRELKNPQLWLPSPSATFHGRDLFAPAAAQLAAQLVAWEALGPEVHDWVLLPDLTPTLEKPGKWRGIALSVDRFGNIITNLPSTLAPLAYTPFALQANAVAVQRHCNTFADSHSADPFVYNGSSGYFEVGINGGSAANTLGIQTGDPIILELNA